MATNLTNTTFATTYKDDFADSDNFHRILFNSGRALQARELTQSQTIMQREMQRFGDNIFKEGAVVRPGGANINQKFEFVKLDTSINTLPADISTLVGTSFTGQTSGVIAKVLEVVAASGSDPATLYVQYTNTSSALAGTSTIRMTNGEDINNGSDTLTVQTTNTTANPATGVGTQVTLLSGVYYARGHFVFTQDQSKIISKYTDTPDANVGFKVVEEIITAADNTALYDNQGSVPNLAAPGADRYRIRLTIALDTEVDSDENFVTVAVVKKGVIYNAINANDAYNVPNEVVAKRIFENSGDYFVKPFTTRFDLDSDNTKLQLVVSAGTAVVDGFRASRTFPTTLRINRSTQTTTINNEVVAADYGNFVIVNPNVDSDTQGVPNINVFQKLTLKNDSDFQGTTIGTARVKAIDEDGINLKYNLFDVKMNAGQAFRNVKSIGTSITDYFNPILENNKAVIKETSNSSSLFLLPRPRPKALTDISLTVQERFVAATDGVGTASISLSGTGETFANTDDWIIGSDSNIISPSTLFDNPSVGGVGTQSSTITGLPANKTLEILAYVNKANASVKTKTLSTRSISVGIQTDAITGKQFLPLNRADIFSVNEVLKDGDSNISYIDRFTLDNGQRDNHYDLGRLVLKGGQSAPAGSVFINYQHFEHGVSGDFFAINSYTGQVNYDQIPKHRLSDGRTIPLRDVLDFRPVMDSDGEFAGGIARAIKQPRTNTLIQADIEYFLATAGKLVIDRNGIIRFIRGNPAFSPVTPDKPDGTLGLYDIKLNANTGNDSDVAVRKIEHKRFTMKDIGFLEKRIDKLEEVTSLSALELDTKHFQVLDSAGNDRTKGGFFIDNFTTHSLSAIDPIEYRAALDPVEHCIRPTFTEENIRLIYDSAQSTGVRKIGDNIYLEHEEIEYINQDLASKAIQINPFSVVVYEGTTTLSPASDEWRDVNRLADKTVPGGTRLSTNQAYNWNNWSWNWGGIATENLKVGSSTGAIAGTVNRVVSEETVLELVEDRVTQTALLPFMRSRKVFFKVQGMRPNTRVFPFFDGTLISDFTRSEAFQFYSDATEDFGNTLKGATTHPDGSSTLTTNGDGEITGSFIVPNNDNIKFRVGQVEFKIMDISANNEADAAAIAKAPYSAKGFLDTKEATYQSTRVLNVQGVRIRDNARYQVDDGGDNNHGKGTVISDANLVTGTTNTWSSDPNANTYGNWANEFAGLGSDPLDPFGGAGAQIDTNNNDAPDNGTHCCTAAEKRGDMSFTEVKKLRAWHRKQSVIWQEGYDIWGKIIADNLVAKSQWQSDRVRDFYDNKINGKYSIGALYADIVITPMSMLIGTYQVMKKKFELKDIRKWQ